MIELAQLRQTAHVDLTRLFQRAAMISSGIVLIISSLVLLGWRLDIPLLVGSFTLDLAPMSIRSAIAFIVASLSLGCLQWRSKHKAALRVSQVLAIAVILLGLLGLSETGLNRPIEQWFAQNLPHFNAWVAPGWKTFGTGFSFVLVGNALLLSSCQERWLHRIARLLTLSTALIAVNSLLNNVHPIGLTPSHPVPSMGLLTALTFLILGAGIQALHLDEAAMQVVRISEGSSTVMVCQLFWAAIALAIIEAVVTLWEQPRTTGEIVVSLSLLTIKTVFIVTLLTGWSISLLTRIRQDYQQAEAIVDTSLTWLQLAQEAASLGRWDWDVESDQMRWCHYQEQLFGLVPGTFAGTFAAFLNCVHPDDRDSVQQVLTRVITIQQDYFDEFRVVWADASVHWILSKGRCFCNSAGKVVRVSGICLDITEHQQIQEQRHQLLHLEQVARAKAETANRMKDEFLSILSHEVRTPLNSVLGWIQILRSRSPSSNLTAQGIEALDRNAQAQAQILEDLLDMAQVIQGKLQLQLQSTNLNAVIGDAVDLIRPAARAKHIHIAAKAKQTHTGTSEFWGDPDRLRQVVWNLLSNAVKFTPPGGNITVTLIQSDIEAQIQVSDTGKGISAEFLPYVFDRFRQEDSTLTRSHGGLGLGLALVRYLVELHGGTVVAASEGLDRGATFTISLPLCSEP